MKVKKSKLFLSAMTALALGASLTGCGGIDKEELVGIWDNDESSISIAFHDDGSADITSFNGAMEGTYEIDGEEIVISVEGLTADVELNDGTLVVEGYDGTFYSVDEAGYYPDEDSDESEESDDSDLYDDSDYFNESDEESIDIFENLYGDYTNDNGTISIEASIFDDSVDYSFNMNSGTYMSGSLTAASDDGTILDSPYFVVTYDESIGSINVSTKDDSGDMDEFVGEYTLTE